jgi:lycopene cyclase-like protein
MAAVQLQQHELEVLVVGGGPAALCISAALAEQQLAVGVVAPGGRQQRWANTYGIWGAEVDALGLAHLLSHRWHNTVSHFGQGPTFHGRDYGLFDKEALQQHWLSSLDRHGVPWFDDAARSVSHQRQDSLVTTASGVQLRARLVVDGSGHQPVFVTQRQQGPIAGQAAYGVVGRFSKPPIEPGQFVFMDYRSDHLDDRQRQQAPTFLYAMDLGDDVYFVEETSLALAPAVPFAVLKQRLHQRLSHHGVAITELQHEEFCLFPMDPPLPDLGQRVVGFGGAGGMVHPASCFMVGSLLRRAPKLAAGIAQAINEHGNDGAELARRAWQSLWPQDMVVKRAFYRFGLAKLMGFDETRLRHHFAAFFQLPDPLWYGFLTNTLSLGELSVAMGRLFAQASWDVRAGLLLPARQPLAAGDADDTADQAT